MKTRKILLACAGVGLLCAAVAGQHTDTTAAQPIVVSLDSRQTGAPTSKYEFGIFIVNLGPLVDRIL